MATLLQTFEPAIEDRVERTPVRMWARVDFGDVCENAVLRDLSATGFGIETSRSIPDGARIAVTIGAAAPFAATVVHASRDRYGCQLDTPLDGATLAQLTRDGPFASARPSVVAANEAFAPVPSDKLPLPVRVAAIFGAATLCWSVVVAIGIAIIG